MIVKYQYLLPRISLTDINVSDSPTAQFPRFSSSLPPQIRASVSRLQHNNAIAHTMAPVQGCSVHIAPGSKYIVNIKFYYKNGTTSQKGDCGSSDGKTERFALQDSEYISAIKVVQDKGDNKALLYGIQFITNTGRMTHGRDDPSHKALYLTLTSAKVPIGISPTYPVGASRPLRRAL